MTAIFSVRRIFLITVLLTVLIGVSYYATTVWAADPAPAAAGQPAAAAQVVWVKGTLKATGDDHKERTLKRGDMIYPHDTLTTDKTSTGQIVFSDGGLMSLREDTQFKIDEYKYSKDGKSGNNQFVGNLVKGGFRTITGALSKANPENYKVNTPVATIGVRGTEYSAYYQSGQLSMEISKGLVSVANAQGRVVLDPNLFSYANIAMKKAPELSKVRPAIFTNQPPLEQAKPSSELTKAAAVSAAPSSAASGGTTTSGGATGSGASSGGHSSVGGGGNCGSLDIH